MLRGLNVGSRIEILKKDSRCFLCLKKGHISKHCLSKYECRKCNGRHNISICSKSKNDFTKDDSKKNDLKNDDPNSYQSSSNQVIAHAGVLKGSLLQTARAQICNIETEETLTTRILFDTGSQRTYITENLRKLLKLKTLRTENVIINTFGKLHEPKLETLDVVQAKVKHRSTNEYTFIEAPFYRLPCKPLRNQEISLAKRSYENLSSLDLADFNEDNSELKIGVLVGVDYYHSFFTGKLIRNVQGPVASASVFGWILSGRFPCSGESASCLSIETHSMRCSLQ